MGTQSEWKAKFKDRRSPDTTSKSGTESTHTSAGGTSASQTTGQAYRSSGGGGGSSSSSSTTQPTTIPTEDVTGQTLKERFSKETVEGPSQTTGQAYTSSMAKAKAQEASRQLIMQQEIEDAARQEQKAADERLRVERPAEQAARLRALEQATRYKDSFVGPRQRFEDSKFGQLALQREKELLAKSGKEAEMAHYTITQVTEKKKTKDGVVTTRVRLGTQVEGKRKSTEQEPKEIKKESSYSFLKRQALKKEAHKDSIAGVFKPYVEKASETFEKTASTFWEKEKSGIKEGATLAFKQVTYPFREGSKFIYKAVSEGSEKFGSRTGYELETIIPSDKKGIKQFFGTLTGYGEALAKRKGFSTTGRVMTKRMEFDGKRGIGLDYKIKPYDKEYYTKEYGIPTRTGVEFASWVVAPQIRSQVEIGRRSIDDLTKHPIQSAILVAEGFGFGLGTKLIKAGSARTVASKGYEFFKRIAPKPERIVSLGGKAIGAGIGVGLPIAFFGSKYKEITSQPTVKESRAKIESFGKEMLFIHSGLSAGSYVAKTTGVDGYIMRERAIQKGIFSESNLIGKKPMTKEQIGRKMGLDKRGIDILVKEGLLKEIKTKGTELKFEAKNELKTLLNKLDPPVEKRKTPKNILEGWKSKDYTPKDLLKEMLSKKPKDTETLLEIYLKKTKTKKYYLTEKGAESYQTSKRAFRDYFKESIKAEKTANLTPLEIKSTLSEVEALPKMKGKKASSDILYDVIKQEKLVVGGSASMMSWIPKQYHKALKFKTPSDVDVFLAKKYGGFTGPELKRVGEKFRLGLEKEGYKPTIETSSQSYKVSLGKGKAVEFHSREMLELMPTGGIVTTRVASDILKDPFMKGYKKTEGGIRVLDIGTQSRNLLMGAYYNVRVAKDYPRFRKLTKSQYEKVTDVWSGTENFKSVKKATLKYGEYLEKQKKYYDFHVAFIKRGLELRGESGDWATIKEDFQKPTIATMLNKSLKEINKRLGLEKATPKRTSAKVTKGKAYVSKVVGVSTTVKPSKDYTQYKTTPPTYKGYRKYTKPKDIAVPYKEYKKYEPQKPYDGYTKYKPYTPYKPYQPEKPYKDYDEYKPYTPYTPYKPYTPYTPYKPYTPYSQYDDYKKYETYKQYTDTTDITDPFGIILPKGETLWKKSFTVEVKIGGKFKVVGKKLPIGQALKRGSDITTKTLAATFRIKETGLTQARDIKFKPKEKIFREYSIRGGQRVDTPLTFIQRRGTRLGTRGEVGEITQAKKRKINKIRRI